MTQKHLRHFSRELVGTLNVLLSKECILSENREEIRVFFFSVLRFCNIIVERRDFTASSAKIDEMIEAVFFLFLFSPFFIGANLLHDINTSFSDGFKKREENELLILNPFSEFISCIFTIFFYGSLIWKSVCRWVKKPKMGRRK